MATDTTSIVLRRLAVAASAAVLLPAGAASGSIKVAADAQRPALRVDARGFAEVSWTAGGARRTLLVPPRGLVLPGGRISEPDVSRPAAGISIPFRRVVRRTPDGRLWALQAWRVLPGRPVDLRLSRWRGRPTRLTLSASLVGAGHALAGRATFAGRPVFGFSPTPAGKRVRIYAYLDCFMCPSVGSGWSRMVGVATRSDGSFAYRVPARFQAPRYRALLPGPNLGTTLAPDAAATAVPG